MPQIADRVDEGALGAEERGCSEAIGEQAEEIFGLPRDDGFVVGVVLGDAERRAGRSEALRRVFGVEAEGVRVTGVGVTEDFLCGIDHPVKDGQKCFGALQLLDQGAVDRLEQIRRRGGLGGIDADGAHRKCHDQRGAEPVGCDIADHGPDLAVGELEQLIEVAADGLGG